MAEEQIIATDEELEELVEIRLVPGNKKLRRARREKCLTQKDLHLITGIPLTRIRQIENLWLIPSREVMEEISAALERPVEFLFPPKLIEAIEEGVFYERKAQLDTQQLVALTETKRLGYQRPLISAAEEVGREVEIGLLKNKLKDVMTTLTFREQRVLTLRFGLYDEEPETLEEVGQKFRVTKERIRQIEKHGLIKLRHPARNKKLKDFLK